MPKLCVRKSNRAGNVSVVHLHTWPQRLTFTCISCVWVCACTYMSGHIILHAVWVPLYDVVRRLSCSQKCLRRTDLGALHSELEDFKMPLTQSLSLSSLGELALLFLQVFIVVGFSDISCTMCWPNYQVAHFIPRPFLLFKTCQYYMVLSWARVNQT